MRPPVVKNAGKIVLGLALGAGILVAAGWLMDVKPKELVAAIDRAAIWSVPASIGALFVLFALGALRWNGSLRPILRHTFWQGYWAMLISYPVNAILPAKGGDLFRVNVMAVRTGVARATILGGEILDKAMELCGPLPVIAVLLLTGAAPAWLGSGAVLMGGVLAAIAAFVVAMRRKAFSEATWFGRTLGELRQAYVGRKVRDVAVTALVFAPLPWVGESAAIWLVGQGFGVHLTAVQAFCTLVALKVGMVIPTPGGIGSVEAAGATALVFFGVPSAEAFAFLLVYRTSQLASGSLIGAAFITVPVRIGPAPATPPESARAGSS